MTALASSDNVALRSLLVETAREGELLTYGQVVKWLYDEPWTLQVARSLYVELDCIAEKNKQYEEPLLSALVVRKRDNLPGRGFFKKFCPEADDDAKQISYHAECVAAVRSFDWSD